MCGYFQPSLIPHHHHRHPSDDRNTRRLRPAASCYCSGNPVQKQIILSHSTQVRFSLLSDEIQKKKILHIRQIKSKLTG